MFYGKIKPVDIANGIGCRVSLFVSGCRNHCVGCFQPETWDFHYGKPYTLDTYQCILDLLDHDWIDGLSVLGGEPLEAENHDEVYLLCYAVKKLMPQKTIWLYTGYKWEGINHLPVMDFVDIVVDGKFHQEEKNISLRFRGSENQRIIDVKQSRQKGEVVLWQDSLQESLSQPSYCSGR